ncbi:MAG: acyl-CoA dehydrogenase family protein [Acidobacteriota bacterium]
MDFEIKAETRERLARIDEFVEQELFPLEERFLSQPFAELLPAVEEKRRQVKELGLWAPGHPREHGGLGLGLVELGLISEALGRSPLGHFTFGCHAPDAGNIEILHQYGSEAQKEQYLDDLIAGRKRSCFSMTEPDMPGSNPVLLETSAVRDGDEWVINGRKWYTTAADGADLAVVMAVTDPDQPRHRRASMILVPADTPGFVHLRRLPVMGEEGDGYFSHSEILYENCRVPVDNLLGPQGQAFVIAQERLGPGRIHHCMRWLGICRRAFDLLCSRATQRTIADGQTLADRELIQAWIAELYGEIRAARLITLHTAWQIEREGWRAAREDISMIKFQVAGTLQKVLDRALQVHGGLGMVDDTPIAWFFRHERAARIYDGPDEVHKLSLARRILRGWR